MYEDLGAVVVHYEVHTPLLVHRLRVQRRSKGVGRGVVGCSERAKSPFGLMMSRRLFDRYLQLLPLCEYIGMC